MFTPVKLIGIGVASLGVIGGTAGAIYAFQAETITIEKKLLSENKKILKKENETLWTIKLSSYKKIKETNQEVKLTEDKWDTLKSWCFEKTKQSFDSNNKKLYEGIKQVCTVPSHREKFESETKTLAGDGDWATKSQAYQGTEINGITKDAETAKKLQAWCKTALDKEYEDNEKNEYPLVLKWCTKTGN